METSASRGDPPAAPTLDENPPKNDKRPPHASHRLPWFPRLLLFVLMLYLFLGAIKLLEESFDVFGVENLATHLLGGLENPFAGLAVGILATALLQSSSATTCIVVGMVGKGVLPLEYAVPVVMGANIGTSVTNTMVSLGHITQDAPFRRAFAGATVHDLFNLMTVAILFPLELTTHFLRNSSVALVGFFFESGASGEAAGFNSPIKTAVKAFAKAIRWFFEDGLGIQGTALGVILAIVSLALVVFSLVMITKNMRVLMADKIEVWLNRVLKRSGLLGLAIGIVITMLVQSSSITTSLLIPMFGAGVLKLENGFPIMVGANIGTTVTALLAASVTGPLGLQIAIVHLLFNLTGTLIFFPIKPIRRIPIMAAEKLAEMAARNRIWVVIYLAGVFVVIPLLGILIWK